MSSHSNVEFIGCYNDRFLFLIDHTANISGYPTFFDSAHRIPVYISADNAHDVNTRGICADKWIRNNLPCIKPFFGIATDPEKTALLKGDYVQGQEIDRAVMHMIDHGVPLREKYGQLIDFYLNAPRKVRLRDRDDHIKRWDYIFDNIFAGNTANDVSQLYDYYSRLCNREIAISISNAASDIRKIYRNVLDAGSYYKIYASREGKLVKGEMVDNGTTIERIVMFNQEQKIRYGKEAEQINRRVGVNNFMGFPLNRAKSSRERIFPTIQEIADYLVQLIQSDYQKFLEKVDHDVVGPQIKSAKDKIMDHAVEIEVTETENVVPHAHRGLDTDVADMQMGGDKNGTMYQLYLRNRNAYQSIG